jgi:RNA polymerase sigma-70 factor (ECF subfamily)
MQWVGPEVAMSPKLQEPHPIDRPNASSSGRLRVPARAAPKPAGAAPRATSELRLALGAMRSDLFLRAVRLCRNRDVAEDLVHETLERALRFERHYAPGTSPRAWVFQILFRLFVTRCRSMRRQARAMSSYGVDPSMRPTSSSPADASMGRGLARQLQALPEPFRRAIELVDIEEISYRDAATALGVPLGTVMSRLHRGRGLLRAQLESERQSLAA